ncbi:MAG TPA: protein kinase [Gemmatimonadaceae bacterium]|nr:protein kinase [Gemmatimonadaceae bacterium]
MNAPSSGEWQPEVERRLLQLVDEALERPAESRDVLLIERLNNEQDLLAKARALLAACVRAEEDEGPFATRAAHFAAPLVLADTSHEAAAQARMRAELWDRLQDAFAGRYTLERELRGGGMARVFVATESALERHIVVKVLPPEALAAMSAERFRREVQVAAQLQHPHIVPLLAAGVAGNILYYTMPFVKGESLRDKLERDGTLSASETVRILRDIADALAYSHAHGLVHRDVKPGNVLISGNHAMVTDFGVAKAVSEATVESTITGVGIPLGTPAYMAPEQAAADANIDARADLYALGCTAYEMLCGHAPFTGSVRQVLAQHLNTPPEPIETYRPDVPPDLRALIMQLLAKDPAERVQRTDDLLTILEAMSTSSPGVMGLDASVADSSWRAVIRRKQPARVAAFFAIGSFAVLAAAYGLVISLGLPWWVLGTAAVLIAIELPIMFFTRRMERNRADAGVIGAASFRSDPLTHWLTWRRASTGGLLAFAALGSATAVYSAMRLLGVGPAGTLIGAGLIHERQPIVLADFVNRARDTTLGPTLTEALRVDLSQSPVVRLAEPSTLSEALQRMQHAPTAAMSPSLAQQIAAREGMKAIVTGEIDPLGRGYVLSAKVVAANDGRVLRAVRETSADDAALISAVERLSKSLRERIGESLRTIRATEPLAAVTTPSLEALRDYTEGTRIANSGESVRGVELLREAVRIDTGFAMAWRALAAVLNNQDAPPDQWVYAGTRAFQYRQRLPELERQQTVGFYYYFINSDLPKAAAAYRAILDERPDDPIALNVLGLVLMEQHQFAAADSLFERGVVSHPQLDPYYANLVWDKLRLKQWTAAESAISRWARALPRDPSVGVMRALAAADERDFARADSLADAAYPQTRDDPSWRQYTVELQASLSEVRGQIATAERYLRDAMDMAAKRQNGPAYLRVSLQLANIQVRYRNTPGAGLAIMAAARTRFPLDSMAATDRQYAALAHFYYGAGQVDEARRLLASYERAVPEGVRRGDHDIDGVIGDLAQTAGRVEEAATQYHAWNNGGPCVECGLYELGELYDRVGRRDSAAIYYQRGVDAGADVRIRVDADHLAVAYQRLGELAEQRGDTTGAVENYSRMLDLWKNADRGLQPTVRAVGARVRALSRQR